MGDLQADPDDEGYASVSQRAAVRLQGRGAESAYANAELAASQPDQGAPLYAQVDKSKKKPKKGKVHYCVCCTLAASHLCLLFCASLLRLLFNLTYSLSFSRAEYRSEQVSSLNEASKSQKPNLCQRKWLFYCYSNFISQEFGIVGRQSTYKDFLFSSSSSSSSSSSFFLYFLR